MTPTLVPALASGGLVGFSLGLVGGGGSILATPLLLYVVGVASPHVAIGTSALAVSINAYANLLAHARKGHVRWLCAAVFALVDADGNVLAEELLIEPDRTCGVVLGKAALESGFRRQVVVGEVGAPKWNTLENAEGLDDARWGGGREVCVRF